jgi:hypothetical protein
MRAAGRRKPATTGAVLPRRPPGPRTSRARLPHDFHLVSASGAAPHGAVTTFGAPVPCGPGACAPLPLRRPGLCNFHSPFISRARCNFHRAETAIHWHGPHSMASRLRNCAALSMILPEGEHAAAIASA